MSLKVWNGSSWASATPRVWNGSTWTSGTNGYVWDGATWVRFYPNFNFGSTTILAQSTGVGPGDFPLAIAGWSVTSNSSVYAERYENGTPSSTFLYYGIEPTTESSNYSIYATYVGDMPQGTFNQWLPISGGENWSLVNDLGVYSTLDSVVDFSLARSSDTSNVLTSWSVELIAIST